MDSAILHQKKAVAEDSENVAAAVAVVESKDRALIFLLDEVVLAPIGAVAASQMEKFVAASALVIALILQLV